MRYARTPSFLDSGTRATYTGAYPFSGRSFVVTDVGNGKTPELWTTINNTDGTLSNVRLNPEYSSTVGTVTSVTLSAPTALFSAQTGTVTASGTLTLNLAAQAQKTVFSGPASGANATPTFRLLIASDLPTHTHITTDIISGVFTPAFLGTGTPNNTTYLRGDGVWATFPAVISLSNANPAALGTTASPGVGNTAARTDHVHPIPFPLTATAPLNLSTTAAVGAANEAARSDHIHKLPTGLRYSLGQVTIAQNGLVNLTVGPKNFTVACPGLLVGDIITLTPVNLLGDGYDIGTGTCTTAGQLVAKVYLPVISIGVNLSIPINVGVIR